MTDKIKFTFLARPDDLTTLARLAGACDISSAAMLRKLIRGANELQKNPPVAQGLAADATSGLDNRSHLETNSYAESTRTRPG